MKVLWYISFTILLLNCNQDTPFKPVTREVIYNVTATPDISIRYTRPDLLSESLTTTDGTWTQTVQVTTREGWSNTVYFTAATLSDDDDSFVEVEVIIDGNAVFNEREVGGEATLTARICLTEFCPSGFPVAP